MLTLPPTRIAPNERVSVAGAADLDHVVDAAAAGELHRRLVPFRRGLVIDAERGAERLGALELLVARRGDDRHECPSRARIAARRPRRRRCPAAARSAGDQLGVLHHRVPRGDGGARQRRAFLAATDASGIFTTPSSSSTTYSASMPSMPPPSALRVHLRPRLAAGPALEETAGDPVAGLHARDAGADLDHFAGAVGQRNEIVAHRHAVGAAHDAEIAKIERTGCDLNQHLPVLRLRLGRSTLTSASMPAPPSGN